MIGEKDGRGNILLWHGRDWLYQKAPNARYIKETSMENKMMKASPTLKRIDVNVNETCLAEGNMGGKT